jgi:hypothetical protein
MKSRIHGLVLALGLCSVLSAPSSIAARRVGTAATTGLLSLTRGHVAILTLADVGNAPNAVVPAVLQILDGENRILATSRGELRPGKPLEVQVEDDLVTGSRLAVRARVVVFDEGRRLVRGGPLRMATFELMNTSTGDIALETLGPICFPGGGVIEAKCEGQLLLTGEPVP